MIKITQPRKISVQLVDVSLYYLKLKTLSNVTQQTPMQATMWSDTFLIGIFSPVISSAKRFPIYLTLKIDKLT